MLLVREAGGFVSDADGGKNSYESGSIIAGNEHTHPALLQILKSSSKAAA
jgi:myo-inositol-1(or 4)-monophosphatase